MFTRIEKKQGKHKRHKRVRARVVGSGSRPRAAIFRSNKHIYVQLIDDTKAATILGMGDSSISGKGKAKIKKTENAKALGKHISELARQKGINSIVFDRGGFRYHGRVKALAEGLREGGLSF
jgi:large subunit ribosomal protein L18